MQSTVRYGTENDDGMMEENYGTASACVRHIREQPTMDQAVQVLRAHAEEASAHWEREADTGAMMLAEIHAGLGMIAKREGGFSTKDVLDRVAQLIEEARLEDRKASAAWWDDTEARAEEAHAVYQREAHRRGDVRHLDAYADLPEDTKEWDRVLMRWVAAAIRARGEKGV